MDTEPVVVVSNISMPSSFRTKPVIVDWVGSLDDEFVRVLADRGKKLSEDVDDIEKIGSDVRKDADKLIKLRRAPAFVTISTPERVWYWLQLKFECATSSHVEQELEEWPALVDRKGFVFPQDNDKPHSVKSTCEKLEELSWETMIHPAYSPDVTLADQ
ncbi:hypothetical protein ILUMI_22503, partial [Ignelater luminosus]